MNPNDNLRTAIKKAGGVSDFSNVNVAALNQIADVDAKTVVNAPVVPTVPKVEQPPVPSFDAVAESSIKGTQTFLEQQQKNQEAKMGDITRLIDGAGVRETFQSTLDQQASKLGYADSDTLLSRLTDESTKLAQLQGKYRLRGYDISTSPETKAKATGLYSEMERRQAIEVGNQALIVQALQGNYETARQTARDVADLEYQDKSLKLNVLIKQYDAISNLVTGEQARILEEKKAQALKDAQNLEYTRSAVQAAIASGSASPDELYLMTNPNATLEQKQAVAAEVTARGASETRRLTLEDRSLDRAVKQAQLNKLRQGDGISWSERSSILKLAEAGDPAAIQALGYDPRQTPEKTNAQVVARDSAFKELQKINGLVSNNLGISASSGTIQSPMLSRMLGLTLTGLGVGGAAGSVIPGAGTLAGLGVGGVSGLLTGAVTGAAAKREKENFLGQMDFLMSGDSFDKFRELKASGVTFGQTTEKEWDAVRKAANELESFATRDGDGKLTGFKGSEAQLRQLLVEYQTKTQQFANSFIDEESAPEIVGAQTMQEINALMGTFNPASFYK